jgi:uncharacterized protein (DUF983 family)
VSIAAQIAVSILAAVAVVMLLAAIGVYLIIASAWREYQQSDIVTEAGAPALSGAILFRRALARKCPACGQGAISRSFLQMNTGCPHCGVTFWRAEGEWMGPSVINYAGAFGAALITWAALVMLNGSEAAQLVLASAAAVVAVVVMTPWSRSFWTLFLFLNGEVR